MIRAIRTPPMAVDPRISVIATRRVSEVEYSYALIVNRPYMSPKWGTYVTYSGRFLVAVARCLIRFQKFTITRVCEMDRIKPQRDSRTLRASSLAAGIALVAGLAIGIPSASGAATTSYFNANTLPNQTKSSATTNVRGGAIEAVIGNRATAYLRTLNVFGEVMHTTTTNGAYATMSHVVRFDGRSTCRWSNWESTTPNNPGFMHCRVTT